jgi:hypothetical protein
MENEINIPLPNFSFSDYINKKAKNYALSYFSQVPFRSKQDVEQLEIELFKYNKVSDRVQFIGVLINSIIKVTKEHTDKCTKETCSVEEKSQDVLYFLYGKLEEDDIPVDIQSFTTEEVYDNSEKITKIIKVLDELKAGQEIIFEEIELIERVQSDFQEADSLQVLGKSKWYKFLGGIILEYASNKVLDGIFKAQILPILSQIGLGRFLN